MKSSVASRSKHSREKGRDNFFSKCIQLTRRLTFPVFQLVYKHKLLSFITLLGFSLRFLGTNPGYPQIHSDEPSIQEATRILVMYHKYDPQNYYYGSLLSIIYALFTALIGIPIFFVQVLLKDSNTLSILGIFGFLDYFYQKVEHGGYYFDSFYNFFPYWTRYATAILSSTTIILVFLLTSRLFTSKKAGLLAAFLTAINYRHVISSTLALADAPTAVFVLLSLLLSIRLLKTQTPKAYLWAGVGIGLALSVKYFIYIIPAFFICSLLGGWRKKSGFLKNCNRTILNKNLYLALLIAAIVFVVINPYLFINRQEVDSQMLINAKRYGLDLPTLFSKITPPFDNLISQRILYPYWYLFRFGYGQFLSVTIILGMLYSAAKYRKPTILILSVIIPYFFLFSAISGNAPVRNYAPITPLLLIFPAVLVISLVQKVRRKNLRLISLVLLISIISFSSLKNSFLSSYYSSQPLNYNNYFAWMNKHFRDGLTIARTQASFLQKVHTGIPLVLYDGGIGLSLDELREAKASYAIFTSTDTTLSNATTLSRFNKEIAHAFFDETRLWNIMNNTYLSLALRELTHYSPVFFVKPYWQSLEPAIMVIKVPHEQSTEETKILSESFEKKAQEDYIATSPISATKKIRLPYTEGINNSQGLLLPFKSCSDLVSIRLFTFPVAEGYRYRAEGFVKRAMNKEYKQYGNGFLRLNFYTQSKNLSTTHVTRLAQKNREWEVLKTTGIAPKMASYASLEFQTDTCFKNESYTIDNIIIYKALKGKSVEEMAKMKKDLPKNFIWLPEIL